MEYLDGETLADKIAKGPLPLDQALRYAIEIADALDKAHRAGIVHRDLKPGNVMLTKGGTKLLDFGLAKTGAPAVVGASLSMLPTTPPNLTAQGTILGTFQYMAPEQLEGQDADARTDIFAFGAVLYEMLTGKKAFEGKSHASLIGAIMHSEPPPLSVVQPLAPRSLDRIVRACLAKDADDRIQSARDVVLQLTWVIEDDPGATAAGPSARRGDRERMAWALVAVATAAAIALGIPYFRHASTTDSPLVRFAVVPPQNVTFGTAGGQSVPAISPDGRRVAFVATRAGSSLLWVRALDSLEAQPLPGTENAAFPFWSPDSRAVGFFASDATLKTIDASGGPVRTLCNVPSGAAGGGTWSPAGVIVFSSLAGGGLFTVPANGGTPAPITTPDASHGERAHRFPSFLPDGRHFLYWATPSNTILLGSLDSKETTRLLTADSQAVYVAPGSLLFVRQGTLLAQRFDARRATLTGDAVPVADSVLADATGAAAFAASSSGVLAYRTGTLGAPTQLTWVDRAGRPLGPVGQPGRYRNPALSPDGTRVAVEATDAQARTQDIWLVELARGVTSRFTFDPGNDIYPVWSPDGSRIMFGSDRGGGVFNLYQKRADGIGTDEPMLKSNVDMAPYSWSPDGRFVVYRTIASSAFNLGILPLAGIGRRTSLSRRDSARPRGKCHRMADGWLTRLPNRVDTKLTCRVSRRRVAGSGRSPKTVARSQGGGLMAESCSITPPMGG